MTDENCLYKTLANKSELETRNVLLQFDRAIQIVDQSDGTLRLTAETIGDLHRIGIQDIYACAGRFRMRPVYISNSPHTPPPHGEVRKHIEEMCRYVNENTVTTPIHAAAYILWKLNWIHPFSGGNGRTSRIVSYLVLSIKLGFRLPGANTIPLQIVNNRGLYYAALVDADSHWRNGRIDLTKMESMLAAMLFKQLGYMLPRSTKP